MDVIPSKKMKFLLQYTDATPATTPNRAVGISYISILDLSSIQWYVQQLVFREVCFKCTLQTYVLALSIAKKNPYRLAYKLSIRQYLKESLQVYSQLQLSHTVLREDFLIRELSKNT